MNKIYLTIKDLTTLIIKQPYLISSYPKAGSTYIRFTLFNFLRIKSKLKTSTNHIELNCHFPEIGKGNVALAPHNFLVKTHYPLNLYPIRKKLKVVRNPYDCLCSAYEYYNRSSDVKFKTINHFLVSKKGINSYKIHLKEAVLMNKKQKGLVVFYEDLISQPFEAYTKILTFLKFDFDKENLYNTLNVVSRKNMQKSEANLSNKKFKDFSVKKDYSKYQEIIDKDLLVKIRSLEVIYQDIK
jgi:hypothetical protein